MHLPVILVQRQVPQTNQTAQNGSSPAASLSSNTTLISALAIVTGLAVVVLIYMILRHLRRRNSEPKYLPGQYLKSKWRQWTPIALYGQIPDGRSPSRDGPTAYLGAGEVSEVTTAAGIRRDISIRSIITLPAYSPSPRPTEQVIAREGERGGMDVVVEFPETADEEEMRREGDMERLYRIRLQRRQELAEQEALRQERREALAQGDFIRAAELRQHARELRRAQDSTATITATSVDHGRTSSTTPTPTPTTAIMALAEHQARGRRDRRISSVSYAELGFVRHDGSRVRASSQESDHRPLLQNASGMHVDGGSGSGSRQSVLMRPGSLHSRGNSFASSAVSVSTGGTNQDTLTPVRSRASTVGSIALTPEEVAMVEEEDLGGLHIHPPEYEQLAWGDAPAYSSPPASGDRDGTGNGERSDMPPRLPPLSALPTIHIDVASPVTPDTPIPSIDVQHST